MADLQWLNKLAGKLARIPIFGGTTPGVVPDGTGEPLTNFLRSDGSWAAPPGASGNISFSAKKGSVGTINKGEAVRITGHDGTDVLVELADADAGFLAIGVADGAITDVAAGDVVRRGTITGLVTNAWSIGTLLFLSNTPGALTDTEPDPSNTQARQLVAVVARSNATTGWLFIDCLQDNDRSFNAQKNNEFEQLVENLSPPANARFIYEDPGAGNAKRRTLLSSLQAASITFQAKKSTAGTINKGQPVYFVGWNGTEATVELADADDILTGPCIGIANGTITDAVAGDVLMQGIISGIDTSSWSVGDELWIDDASPGQLQNTQPTASGSSPYFQSVATVLESNVSTGQLIVDARPLNNSRAILTTDGVRFTSLLPSQAPGGDDKLIFERGTDGQLRQVSKSQFQNPTLVQVRKGSAGTLNNGDVVYVSGYTIDPDVELADNDVASTTPAFGIIYDDNGGITTANFGYVATKGVVDNFDTQTPGWAVGDQLYLDSTAGQLTNVRPTAQDQDIQAIGTVLRISLTIGQIEINIRPNVEDIPNVLDMTSFTGAGKPPHTEGQVFYDGDEHALALHNDEADVTHQVGQEGFIRVYNNSGATIVNGKPVS